ncbi:MAG TPA: hypothetical protein VLT33_46175 [Labilithrix sp.]|nr:hypothetical protein [Labilithrix sp.]
MQGSKKPPIRRDDRAEPDEEGSSPRVDVVNVDGPGSGSNVIAPRSEAAAGMTSLKAQLARLNEQAAAVERSLDEQRRDRSDALDRLEHATERCIALESKITGLEAEAIALRQMNEASLADLQTLRAERDGLLHAVDAAKIATAEVGLLKAENEDLHATLETSMGAAARLEDELGELRKRQFQEAIKVTEQETALRELRTKLDRSEKEGVLAREEAMQAREATAKAENTITTARGEAAKARDDAAKARDDAAKAREEGLKVRQELASAKEDNTKDRSTARDRIDLLERALDDARAATARTESALEASRAEEDRLTRRFEEATARAAEADTRAAAAVAAQAALEQNVKRIREAIAAAFAKIGLGASPPPLPPGVGRGSRAPQSFPPEMLDSVPPSAGDPPVQVPAIPRDAPPRSPPLALELDSGWSSPGSEPPPASARPISASPASKSVPPPPSVVTALAEEAAASPLSVPTPTYASVPPQVHPSVVVPASITRESLSPATRRGEASDLPAPPDAAGEASRDELIARLLDPAQAPAAAYELKLHADWLRSIPPPTFTAALQSVDYNADRPVFELARQWDRDPLCHALIAGLRAEPDLRLREHAAWLLKHLAAPSSWKAIADLARSEEEPVQLRRWLLEALDRLAAGRAIGWRELGDVVTIVAKHPDPSLRDGVVGILVSLDRSDDKRRLLLDILRSDDDEIVLASAVNALAGALPMELDPGLVERLLGHPSPRVQRSVRDLIERAKQTKS